MGASNEAPFLLKNFLTFTTRNVKLEKVALTMPKTVGVERRKLCAYRGEKF